MLSKSVWHYFLIVPSDSVAAADTVAEALSNPSGVVATFQPFPEHYVADFVAADLVSEGSPFRQALEGAVNANEALGSILFLRCKNEYHPNTPENERGIVVSSNSAAFPVGGAVSWSLVSEAIAAL